MPPDEPNHYRHVHPATEVLREGSRRRSVPTWVLGSRKIAPRHLTARSFLVRFPQRCLPDESNRGRRATAVFSKRKGILTSLRPPEVVRCRPLKERRSGFSLTGFRKGAV